MTQTNDLGIALIKQCEGILDGDKSTPLLDPYLCPANYVTQGWGSVLLDTNGKMLEGPAGLKRAKQLYQPITMDGAEELLKKDLRKYELAVRTELLDTDYTSNQFSAMVALCFNIGIGAFTKSSVLRFHKAGLRTTEDDPDEVEKLIERRDVKATNAPDAFLLFKIAGGRILPGLQRRRMMERQLYMS